MPQDLVLDRYTGCLLGLAIGDACGAPHEGGPIERALWRWIGRTPEGLPRWTDDTQMTLDLAASLLHAGHVDQDDLAARFAASYQWRRGYGPGTARVLRRVRRGTPWRRAARAGRFGGSYGNGAAMRAPVLALVHGRDRGALLLAARRSAEVTHAHPLGIEGAVLVALAARALLDESTPTQVMQLLADTCTAPAFAQRLRIAAHWLAVPVSPPPADVARLLGNGMTAPASCITATYIALRHLDGEFNAMLDFVIACGGDVDTIAAMAGALWGIRNGAARLPAARIEARAGIERVATRLHARYASAASPPR